MVRLTLALLATPALAARVEVHHEAASKAYSFAHLSEEDSAAANEALDTLAMLKEDMDNVELQEKYRAAIGEIAWEEDRAFLLSGMKSDQAPQMLGEPSVPGSSLALAELLSGRVGSMSWFTTRLGRYFSGRRDFAIEEGQGENARTKYMIDGTTLSLHSRMHINFPNEPHPRYVIRRAFNYLNPVAVTAGQYMYRILRCDSGWDVGGWTGGCEEGEMLYTITKDRFGRGAMWGQDEYRVYTGSGGCSRYGFGLLSCDRDLQIMYSISAGLSAGSFETTFLAGNVREIDGNHETGRLHDGTELGPQDLEAMQVATVRKVHGSPRPLNWPVEAADGGATVAGVTTLATVVGTAQLVADSITPEQINAVTDLGETLTDIERIAMIPEGIERTAHIEQILVDFVNSVRDLAPTRQWEILSTGFGISVFTGSAMLTLSSVAYQMAWWIHLAKSVIWSDSYQVMFDGSGGATDDLLVSVVAGLQDLTRENRMADVAR